MNLITKNGSSLLRAEAELAVPFPRNVFKAIILSFIVSITGNQKSFANEAN